MNVHDQEPEAPPAKRKKKQKGSNSGDVNNVRVELVKEAMNYLKTLDNDEKGSDS